MRRGDHTPRAFQAPVDVHASADGQVYMFKRRTNDSAVCDDDDDDSDELSCMEMKPWTSREQEQTDKLRNIQLLERKVEDGDNLNKLALQYGCKVADIKRVNNLIQEQDLFALTSIKIPVQKHSIVTEMYTDLKHEKDEAKAPCSSTLPARPLERGRGQSHLQEPTDFLMETDNDIERLIQTSNEQDDQDLPENGRKGGRFSFRGRGLGGYGADWGIQWWNAVVAMLLIGIILPLFYLIYFKTKDNGAVSPEDGVAHPSIGPANSSGAGPGTGLLEPG